MSRRRQPVAQPSERPTPAQAPPRGSSTAFRGRVALALLGALSTLPPYLGPVFGLELDVSDDVEVVDHVVAGVIVVLCAGLAALQVRRDEAAEDTTVNLVLMGICALAALWQTVTHAPLVLDGGEPGAPWDTVILHSSFGPVMVILSIWLFMRAPDTGRAAPRAP